MHPDERFYPDAVTEPGTAVAISSARQSASWGPGTRSGYVMLTETSTGSDELSGSATTAPEPAAPTVQTADVPFPLQNFFYAVQWWIFAAFAVVVYLRWLWLDAAGEATGAAGEPDQQ
jgi:cytochrome oxidase assembly protein ShyY1